MKKIMLLVMLLFLGGCSSDSDLVLELPKEETPEVTIIVELKGAVKFPGLYSFEKGIMLYEVINNAGGLLDNADTERINLVQIFDNNTSVNIPYKEINNQGGSLVNINTASLQELMSLTGIGESKALAIIDYRNSTPFSTIEDIKNVSGIGEQVFSKIKDYITV